MLTPALGQEEAVWTSDLAAEAVAVSVVLSVQGSLAAGWKLALAKFGKNRSAPRPSPTNLVGTRQNRSAVARSVLAVDLAVHFDLAVDLAAQFDLAADLAVVLVAADLALHFDLDLAAADLAVRFDLAVDLAARLDLAVRLRLAADLAAHLDFVVDLAVRLALAVAPASWRQQRDSA